MSFSFAPRQYGSFLYDDSNKDSFAEYLAETVAAMLHTSISALEDLFSKPLSEDDSTGVFYSTLSNDAILIEVSIYTREVIGIQLTGENYLFNEGPIDDPVSDLREEVYN